jgi:hypothetical protein
MAGCVTVYVERFQVHVARDLAGKPRLGMGRHHGVCGLFKFYYCFSPLMAETRASLPPENFYFFCACVFAKLAAIFVVGAGPASILHQR